MAQPKLFLQIFIDPETSDGNENFDSSPSPTTTTNNANGNRSTEYAYVTVTAESTAKDVIASVAKKRNVYDSRDDYVLLVCDSDGKEKIERVLEANEIPYEHQQAATVHGHLGDFHFVFRKITEADDDDSDQEFFGNSNIRGTPKSVFAQSKLMNENTKYPCGWMEKRGKTNRGWKKRYFVLKKDELFYYKDRATYEKKKEPIASIPLTKPAAIIKVVFDGENNNSTNKTSANITESQIGDFRNNGLSNAIPSQNNKKNSKNNRHFYYFDIHTPKRIYSMKVNDYDSMLEWIHLLQRRNEPNEVLNGLDSLMADSEYMHGMDDEKTLDTFNNLDSILRNDHARKYYRNYLHSNYMDEFVDFWESLQSYLSEYHSSTQSKQYTMAKKIFDQYIAGGATKELSEIRTHMRKAIKKSLDRQYVTREIFDDIESSVFNHLNADVWKFFNSIDYYKFIVTYKQASITTAELNSNIKYQWPNDFKNEYLAKNDGQTPKIHIPSNVTGKSNIISPVYLGRSYASSGNGVTSSTGSSGAITNGSSMINSSGSLSPAFNAQTWNGNQLPSLVANSPKGANSLGKKTKRTRKGFGQSVFENAPGI